MTLFTLKSKLSVSQALALCLLATCLGLFANAAHAQDRNYLIEVVLIENLLEAKNATPSDLYYPLVPSALSLSGEKAAAAGFSLVEEGLSLFEEAAKIKGSREFRVMRHFAWRQPGLDAKNAKAIRINVGSVFDQYLPKDLKPYRHFAPASMQPTPDRSRKVRNTTVSGTIKVRLGRFLHVDSHLVYTDVENNASYRLRQSRKMRSREYHYIDNPRFGLLIRILPIEDAQNPG